MKIPKKIVILGLDIDITIVPDGSMTPAGQASSWYQWIKIQETLSEASRTETLLHENIEIIKNNCEIEISHPHLSTLSAVLFAVMRDNNLSFGGKETE